MAPTSVVVEVQPLDDVDVLEKENGMSTSPASAEITYPALSPLRTLSVYITVAGMTFICTMTNGSLAIGIPDIADSLGIPNSSLLWPAAMYSLTSGCTFILAGAIADIVGSRAVYLFGCILLALSVLACGMARNGTELIVYRAIQGVAASCCLPTAISMISQTFPPGRARTRGLAIQGASYPLGYAAGIYLEGVFVDTIGWRWGWYLTAMFTGFVFVAGIWAVPADRLYQEKLWTRLILGVDWVGAILVSSCLGLISYELAVISNSSDSIRRPVNIVLLVLGALLGPASYWWMCKREEAAMVALMPTTVWSDKYFGVICAMLFLSSGISNALELLFSLFFQKVQGLSALQASLRFLPNILIGILNSCLTDAILHRISAHKIVIVMTALAAFAPLGMAIMRPEWSYWCMAFPAMLVLPLTADMLFIVGAVVITDTFPGHRQALGGSIFNTVYQFGSAVGVGTMTVASSVVTANSSWEDKTAPPALLEGYRAAFWACLGASIICCAIGGFGTRGIGKVGLKPD